MRTYNKIRIKILEIMDMLSMFAIILIASGIDSMSAGVILKCLIAPSTWLLARYWANC